MAPGWVQVEDEAALHTLARSRGAEGVPPSRRWRGQLGLRHGRIWRTD